MIDIDKAKQIIAGFEKSEIDEIRYIVLTVYELLENVLKNTGDEKSIIELDAIMQLLCHE